MYTITLRCSDLCCPVHQISGLGLIVQPCSFGVWTEIETFGMPRHAHNSRKGGQSETSQISSGKLDASVGKAKACAGPAATAQTRPATPAYKTSGALATGGGAFVSEMENIQVCMQATVRQLSAERLSCQIDLGRGSSSQRTPSSFFSG